MAELLAPAGNWECAVTAFESGADAVYAGLSRFNARERNRNFTYEEMSRLSRYTKDNGKKFYVTMNTLIKDSEIGDLVDELESLSRLEPDALIIQDLGVLKICRDYFPEFRLHASTQMGIHNSAGLRMAARLGISRVILERQLLLSEIAGMAENRPTELEVFIHGALCCSLSGMCHFSSVQGGYSGNRGKCKQPCRRLYRNEAGEMRPFFSPDDLQGVPLIHEFKKLGIESFKIEGRLKRADYVRQTVTAYRMLLDGDASDKKLRDEAERILKGGAVRPSGIGFYSRGSRTSLLGKPSVQAGEAAAEALSVVGNRWKARALTEIRRGDKLRLPESAGSGIVALTRIECDGRSVAFVPVRRTFTFTVGSAEKDNGMSFRSSAKGLLYRVGSQIGKSAEALERMKRFDERKAIPLTAVLTADGLRVSVTGHPETEKLFSYCAEPARTAAVSAGDLEMLLAHCGGNDWKAGTVTASVSGNFFVPVSVRKQWRRELEALWTDPPVREKPRRVTVTADAAAFGRVRKEDHLVTVFGDSRTPDGSPALRSDPLDDITVETDEAVLPFFVTEPDISGFQERIDKAAAGGIRRFRLTSFFQLAFRYPADAVLTAAHPLPAVNAFAARLLTEEGCRRIQIWPELGDDEAAGAAAAFGCTCERIVSGAFPVLVTRASVAPGDYVSEDKTAGGWRWSVVYDSSSDAALLYPNAVLAGVPVPGCGRYFAAMSFGKKNHVSFPCMS